MTNYWVDKVERAKKAKVHTEEMRKKYHVAIQNSAISTKIYDFDMDFLNYPNRNQSTEITIEALDTVSAGEKYHSLGKTALLNFASYKNPGGMFMNGSKAQEECLCHESFLYNVLEEFRDSFYEWNNRHKNKALYFNRALYSPNILFREAWCCDVITCAAPNKSAAQKYQAVSDDENYKALKSRMRFVLDIAVENEVDILVLGAWGCGVFGQNPVEVATAFQELLQKKYRNCFSKVIFAVPKDTANYDAFCKVFRG